MHIRKATLNDVSVIAELSTAAMAHDELMEFLSPHRHLYPLCRRERSVRRCRRCFYNPSMTMLVMVLDPTDNDWEGVEQVIGHIAVSSTIPPTLPWAQRLWLSLNSHIHDAEDTARWFLHTDWSQSNANVAAFIKMQASMNMAVYLVPKGRHYLYVDHLSVSPDYQRRGIGRALVEHVKSQAATEDLPILLVSSNMAEKFYLSCGFKEIAQWPVAEGFGQTSPLMLWEAT